MENLGHRSEERPIENYMGMKNYIFSQKREAVNQTFKKLLDFSFSDDFLLLRDNDKFDEYRIKREVATSALSGLKQYYTSDVQHSQIDKIKEVVVYIQI